MGIVRWGMVVKTLKMGMNGSAWRVSHQALELRNSIRPAAEGAMRNSAASLDRSTLSRSQTVR